MNEPPTTPSAERDSDPQPHEMNEYEVTSAGWRVGERLTGYHGLITSIPELLNPENRDGEEAPRTRDRKE